MTCLFLFIGLLIIFGTIDFVTQQTLRSNANDPQIQLAEDSASALNDGASPHSLIGKTVNLSNSLAPFVIIYNTSGRVVAGNGQINGQVPIAPLGVLTSSHSVDYHAVTWQPQHALRFAAVIVKANNYYVLSGRSLKEVEIREQAALQNSLTGFLATIIVLIGWYLYSLRQNKTLLKHTVV